MGIGSMGFRKLTVDAGVVQDLNELEIEMEKSGYLYIYCSNESSVDVFFDNIQVVHERSKVLVETHFYPFGLTMAGISSKAFGSIKNGYKFNSGTEFNRDFGLDHYETPFRSFDPQIGRFFQIDPLAENGHNTSSYAFCYGNPILFSDPFGLDTIRNFVSAGSFNDGDVFIFGGNTFVYNGELGIWARMDLLKEVVVTSNPRSNQPPLWNSWLMAFEGAREEYMRSAEEEAERQRLEESRKVSAAEAARLEANTEAMRRGQQVGEQYQQSNGGSGNFFADNWQDVAFMANDFAQAVGNNSSLNTALRMGRPTTMLYVPPGVSIPVSTKVMSTVSKVGTPIAKAAPWVAGFAIGTDIYNNQSISWGNVYQGTVLGLSLIPGAGLIVGGLSLIAEGVSYYYTGQSISDNINQRTNVIYNFK